jgi:hypothetical protein
MHSLKPEHLPEEQRKILRAVAALTIGGRGGQGNTRTKR